MASTERLEGRTSILAALDAGVRRFESILLGPSAKREKLREVLDRARTLDIPVTTVEETELGAQAKSHGGIVALCGPKPLTTLDELFHLIDRLREPPFLLLLDGVDDARDLAMILRTAEAFGVHALLLRRRAWDFDATAVSRASSGAYERMAVVMVDQTMTEVARLRKREMKLLGCMPNGKDSLYTCNLAIPLIIAVGGEKRGLSNAVRSRCDATARIPTRGGPSSLTMTHAAAIALAETSRQRDR